MSTRRSRWALRFYYSRPFVDNAPYTDPTISNLFMESVSTSEGRQTIDGKTYGYIERRYAVSGVTAGAGPGRGGLRQICSGGQRAPLRI